MQRSVITARLNSPKRRGLVPDGAGDFLVEADIVVNVVRVGVAADVVVDLVALGEEMVPIVVVVERVGIEMVGGVDAAAWVAIFVPSAADAVVLLDDGERNACFLELDAHAYAGEPGADHDALKFAQSLGGRGRRAPADGFGIAVGEVHLLEHQRIIFRRHVLTGADVEHVRQEIHGRVDRQRLLLLCVIRKDIDQRLAQFGLQRLGSVFVEAPRAL